jgi:teichuronic acid biosynthesis glycosyltransferase TuaC
VIPVGVDVKSFVPMDRMEARRALGWSWEETTVLLPGPRERPRKNAALFDAVVTELRRRIGTVRSVSLEQMTRDEVRLALNASDVVLMTSLFEGSPVAVKEALACLTPVVSVPVGDNARVLAGLAGCSVAPYDSIALADGVQLALSCGRPPELRERAACYSRESATEALLVLYRSLVSGHTQPIRPRPENLRRRGPTDRVSSSEGQ